MAHHVDNTELDLGFRKCCINRIWKALQTIHTGDQYILNTSVAIMDWYSRRVLSWRVSNTMDSDFCVDALEEAIRCYGAPEIFNTDQGAQFTSEAFTDVLKEANIKISMDGKGRWVDNVFIERLWRSVKYEEVYLKAYESIAQAKSGIGEYLKFYNAEHKHQTLGMTPDRMYFENDTMMEAA